MIRPLKIEDVVRVSDYWEQMMKEVAGECVPEAKTDFFVKFVNGVTLNTMTGFTLEIDNEIYGFILGTSQTEENSRQEVGFCGSLYVDTCCRGEGYHKDLIDALTAKYKELGLNKVAFETTGRLEAYWTRMGYIKSRVVFTREI
jgi:GNAT superfamily N-acetyltransferase